VQTLWTEAVPIIDSKKQASWELKLEDAVPALCEAA